MEFMRFRWSVAIKPYGALGFRGSYRNLFMYNYISVGVDAQVTLNFHRTRESRFYLFSHRIFNKVFFCRINQSFCLYRSNLMICMYCSSCTYALAHSKLWKENAKISIKVWKFIWTTKR